MQEEYITDKEFKNIDFKKAVFSLSNQKGLLEKYDIVVK